MTNDSKHFPPLKKWEAQGYQPDVFGRWIGPHGDVALPLYQGGMLHVLDSFFNVWKTGRWMESRRDEKRPGPKFLMAADDFRRLSDLSQSARLSYRRIAPATNARSFLCTYGWPAPSGDSVFMLIPQKSDFDRLMFLNGAFSSLCFDFVLRQRLVGGNLSWFVVEDCPIPILRDGNLTASTVARIVLSAGRYNLIHRRFAPEWLKLESLYPELAKTEWKHWWAVTEADRLRLRVEIDALSADLYGLDPDDFDWIVRDDRTDPKGFYRVDRDLPFRERLTGLAATAFRASKDGKWSAESAANLSNDEFFDILGIPELTSANAAKAKGLPGPLILARDGCHVWKPETFSPDDPRHGWTWDDCRHDAVALLGSEEAVEKYIAEKPEKEPDAGKDCGDDEPFQLKADKPKPKQGKMF
jgi:hypothetical protein